MTKEEMKDRTKAFALRVIMLVNSLSKSQSDKVLGNQLLRSGTSVGANYRSACRARSIPDFISKINIAEEEADESLYWMELITESGLVELKRLSNLMIEAGEIIAILAASAKTASKNLQLHKSTIQKSAIKNQQ